MKNLSLFITGFLSLTGTLLADSAQAQTKLEAPVAPTIIHNEFTTYVQEAEAKESPVVKKFGANFYSDEYWSDGVYHDYLNAFWTGYNMQSYAYATTCLDNFNLFMNFFHSWKLTVVRRKTLTEMWDLAFTVAGTDLNETWYNCFLFQYDLRDQYARKWGNFADFGDIYLSFIFNMLQNSLNIKSQTENMIEAYEAHDTTTFTQALASVLRSVLDFNSYTSLSSSLEGEATPTSQEFMGFSVPNNMPELSRQEREANIQSKMEPMKNRLEKLNAENYNHNIQGNQTGKNFKLIGRARDAIVNKRVSSPASGPKVQLAENYEWSTIDYVQSPLAFIIGSLHALPSDTDGPFCSSNATALRFNILEGFDATESEEDDTDVKLTSALAYYTAGTYLDEVGTLCQTSITTTLNTDYWVALFATNENTGIANIFTAIPINLLYNAGYMWVDAINYVYYTVETVPQKDWAFFVAYLIGDFAIRIFYHDPTPQQIDQ